MAFHRPSWDEYFLALAVTVSLRGDCRRDQVGAVLVDLNHRVLGVGYNGTDPGKPGCLSGACPRGLKTLDELPPGSGDYSDCISYHAEDNCLRNVGAPRALIEGSTIYITRWPCPGCRALLRHYRVKSYVCPYDLDRSGLYRGEIEDD